jgi:hypothetical protein
MAKKDIQASKGANILNSDDERKKFKSALSAITHQFQLIDDQKESIKENVAELSDMYGLDKKTVRKIATTMYKHNYADVLEENRHFEELYETIVENKLRDSSDPLDDDDLEPDEDGSGEED